MLDSISRVCQAAGWKAQRASVSLSGEAPVPAVVVQMAELNIIIVREGSFTRVYCAVELTGDEAADIQGRSAAAQRRLGLTLQGAHSAGRTLGMLLVQENEGTRILRGALVEQRLLGDLSGEGHEQRLVDAVAEVAAVARKVVGVFGVMLTSTAGRGGPLAGGKGDPMYA